jgi:hypothetical protein
MNYIRTAEKLYTKLESFDLETDLSYGLPSFLDSFREIISLQELIFLYRKEIDDIIKTRLNIFEKEISSIRNLFDVKYYENSLSVYTTFAIFWMLHNKISISDSEISNLICSIFCGITGYRLIDIHSDSKKIGSEAVILGNYLIHIHEKILIESFPSINTVNTVSIINKYFELFSKVEYKEKSNRWKFSPFSRKNVEEISYKAAPLFTIFELIFRYSGMQEEKVDSLMKGIIYWAAAIQMADDLSDTKEDLENGFETIIMSGFYKKYGMSKGITKGNIEKFLTKKRLAEIHDSVQNLFEKSRELFTKNNDEILLLFLELQNHTFNKDMEYIY